MQNVDSTTQAGSIFNEQFRDIEYSGQLNRATQQGAKFALLLSMLEQNPLHRPHIADDVLADNSQAQLAALSHYPVVPLSAGPEDWLRVQQTEKFIQSAELENAKLWLTMHPEPLSMHNNVKHIPSEVVENCSITVRNRIGKEKTDAFLQDPTELYTILNGMENPEQATV